MKKRAANNVFLVMLLLSLICGYAIATGSYKRYTFPLKIDSKNASQNKNGCTYGNIPFSYKKYIVKKGDTLTSIAKDQLGDATRVGELVAFNVSNLPMLASNPRYIELGWALDIPEKLPFEDVQKDQLYTFRGHVLVNKTGELVGTERSYFQGRSEKNGNDAGYFYDEDFSKYYLNGKQVKKEDIPVGACYEATIILGHQAPFVANAIVEMRATTK